MRTKSTPCSSRETVSGKGGKHFCLHPPKSVFLVTCRNSEESIFHDRKEERPFDYFCANGQNPRNILHQPLITQPAIDGGETGGNLVAEERREASRLEWIWPLRFGAASGRRRGSAGRSLLPARETSTGSGRFSCMS